jgi:hypothetical protein
VRKWTSPDSEVAVSERRDAVDSEPVKRARAFRRWIAAGAEPGGLRALAGERTRDAQTRDERPTGAPH